MSKKNRRQGFNPEGEVNAVEGEAMNENEVVEESAVTEEVADAVEAVEETVVQAAEAAEEVAPVETSTIGVVVPEPVQEEVKEVENVIEPAKEEKAPYVTPVIKEEPKKEEVKEEVSGELQVGDTVIIVPTVEKDLSGIRFGGNAYAAKYEVDRFQGKNNEKVVIKTKVSRFTLPVDAVRKVQ